MIETDAKALIWLGALVAFVLKLAADYYCARYKWVQAAAALKAKQSAHERKVRAIADWLGSPLVWGGGGGTVLMAYLVVFMLIRHDHIFPVQAFASTFWYALVALLGAWGDRQRELA